MNARAATRSGRRADSAEQKRSLPLAAAVAGPRATSWWGMLLLMVSEAVLFAALLASYFQLRLSAVLWPPQGVARPELTFSSANTVILILSSVAMQWGVAGIRSGALGRLRVALVIAFILGTIFLGIQVYQFTQVPFAPQDHAYGSLFWTITGINAVYVLVGLLMNLYVQVGAAYGHFGPERRQAVDNAAMYWHFVDVVWLLIFASLFLLPYL